MFYVYEWYVIETGEIFYVGKGSRNRYRQTSKRNKLFKFYIEHFKCDTRIIKIFDNEEDAFKFEHERILELKSCEQAKCNLDYGGIGGCHFVWTDEMRGYKSKYNPMKSSDQRERMKTNNPMHDKDVAKRVGKKHRRAIVIDGVVYDSAREASEAYSVTTSTINRWCKKGITSSNKECKYLDGKPMRSQKIIYRKDNNAKIDIDKGTAFIRRRGSLTSWRNWGIHFSFC